ncbi:MAG TPA: AAA family ATPase [Bryobacteraceae bacterium]|nr:AAA family ATPase [Bryobacteraceae bacterium]
MTAAFPFAAIVGQPQLKLALLLAGVDWRLSVLLKGDKGSGKSTAARSLAGILPGSAPFVNLPIGATEDRLLGGLDLAQALQGHASLKRGLIHEADGGVLYIDEINLLSDALTDALLDVASSGRHYVERDGFSVSSEARFTLLGSMNAEEGSLRPQLLDRFALSLDLEAPIVSEERAAITEARLRFDASPEAFCAVFDVGQQQSREAIARARSLVASFSVDSGVLQDIASAVTTAGVRSLRADLAALRAAIAHAALEGRAEIATEDIETVMPLVLHHRAKRDGPRPPAPPSSRERPPDDRERQDQNGSTEVQDLVFPPQPKQAPELRVRAAASKLRGRTSELQEARAATLRTCAELNANGTFDVVASMTQAFRNTGKASLRADQLAFRKPQETAGIRLIFVVDSSGSHAVQRRMSAVKGAAVGLLQSSLDRKDEVAVISFRGPKAEIALEPCRDADAAQRALEFLPTGGRTPLAHALELARSLVNPSSLVILVTDGRANVPLVSDDPWADALDAAGRLQCASVLVDSSLDSSVDAPMNALAFAMRARRIRLDDFSGEALLNILLPS